MAQGSSSFRGNMPQVLVFLGSCSGNVPIMFPSMITLRMAHTANTIVNNKRSTHSMLDCFGCMSCFLLGIVMLQYVNHRHEVDFFPRRALKIIHKIPEPIKNFRKLTCARYLKQKLESQFPKYTGPVQC